MRIAVVIFAALVTLGLVAFGLVLAQMASYPIPPTASAAGVSSQRLTESAKNDKAPLREGVKGAAPFTSIAQNDKTAGAAAFQAQVPALGPFAACNNRDSLGLSRVVEIDTTGGPAFGTEHFKQYDFLRDKEVVLTFDDGPWPGNTPTVLKALQDNCTKATFFEIGEHATWRPDL